MRQYWRHEVVIFGTMSMKVIFHTSRHLTKRKANTACEVMNNLIAPAESGIIKAKVRKRGEA